MDQRILRLRSRVQQIADAVLEAKAQGETLTFDPAEAPCECELPRALHLGDEHRGRAYLPEPEEPDLDDDGSKEPREPHCLRYRADRFEIDARVAYASMSADWSDDVKAYERLENAKHKRDKARRGDKPSIRPSDAGACGMQVSSRILQPDGYFENATDRRAARLGSIIDREWKRMQLVLYPHRVADPQYTLPGLASTFFGDLYDPVTGDVIEGKSAGSYRWGKTLEEGAAKENIEQGLLECLGLSRRGLYVHRLRLQIIDRADGGSREFIIPWDAQAQAQALDVLTRLIARQTAIVTLGELLPRERSGPSTDPICARHCAARDWCWNLPRAEELGVSGESLTMLGEEPTSERVVWALEKTYNAMVARREAEAAVKRRKAWLVGRPVGRYHAGEYDYSIEPGRAGSAKYKDWRDAVLEWEQQDPETRPPLSSIPVPKGEQSEFSVRRRVCSCPMKGQDVKPEQPDAYHADTDVLEGELVAEVPANAVAIEQPAEIGAA